MSEAHVNLGVMHLNGMGVDKNNETALFHFLEVLLALAVQIDLENVFLLISISFRLLIMVTPLLIMVLRFSYFPPSFFL
jgi:hypothetical protein